MGQNALFNVLAMQENKKEELKKHIESLEALSRIKIGILNKLFLYITIISEQKNHLAMLLII